MPRKDAAPAGSISAQAQQDLVSEGIENYELPKSLVTRIAKSALPENIKMQKETVLSLVKGSTVFINYLAATQVSSLAHDVALSKQHKSISASDVLKALETIEFGDLVDKLQGELLVYRELAKTDKTKRGSVSVGPSTGKGKAPAATTAGAATPGSVSSKGKERAKIVLPASAVAAVAVGGESVSSEPGAAMDVDVDDEVDIDLEPIDPERVETDGDGDQLEEDEETEEPAEEPADEAEDDEDTEELIDTEALNMEDERQDAKGLDAAPVVMEE
ncbi:histone-fold-containing protein [Mycena pura]|uniref:DNA polymerase epsilon subunit D n=1 Tax=Mycena pura TaxID=153505 RepID=A0AAD6VAX3_9AGAR|nr:histone-fold-containing protein [Mycena pura]